MNTMCETINSNREQPFLKEDLEQCTVLELEKLYHKKLEIVDKDKQLIEKSNSLCITSYTFVFVFALLSVMNVCLANHYMHYYMHYYTALTLSMIMNIVFMAYSAFFLKEFVLFNALYFDFLDKDTKDLELIKQLLEEKRK